MPAQAVRCRLRLRTAGPLEGDFTMDAKNFTLLVQGVKEMAAHMRGEDVPGRCCGSFSTTRGQR